MLHRRRSWESCVTNNNKLYLDIVRFLYEDLPSSNFSNNNGVKGPVSINRSSLFPKSG